VLAFILAAAAASWATTVVRMSFDLQAVEADLVIVGRSVKSEPIKLRGYPCTRVHIRIDEVVVGKTASGEVTVIQPGAGKKRVVGVRKLLTNKSYLLFLKKTPDGNYRIVGFNQGAHRVSIEKGTSRKVVITKTRSGKSRGMTLDAARKRIRAVRKRAIKNKAPK